MASYGGIDVTGVLSLADHYAELMVEDGDYQDARSCLERAVRTLLNETVAAERARYLVMKPNA